MGKVIEEKEQRNFRKASFGERGENKTCGYCENMKMIDFNGMSQPRCGYFGAGIAKKYMISVKDTCDGFKRSNKGMGDEVTKEEIKSEEQGEK